MRNNQVPPGTHTLSPSSREHVVSMRPRAKGNVKSPHLAIRRVVMPIIRDARTYTAHSIESRMCFFLVCVDDILHTHPVESNLNIFKKA